MLQKQYTKFLGTPIIDQNNGNVLGEIYDLIIDEQKGKVEAFWVQKGILSGAEKILTVNDIIEWKIKIYVNDGDSIVSPNEIIKIREIIERGVSFYLNKVQTLSGKNLGRVFDFFFDPLTGQILQIEVAKSFLGVKFQKRLIPFSEIYEIKPEAVILKDDYKYETLKLKNTLDLTEVA